MRNCPACDTADRTEVISGYNDTDLSLYCCSFCGMHYVDGSINQAWFDNFYLTQYRTDDKEYSNQRLDDLAQVIRDSVVVSVLDVGGADGELANRLQPEITVGLSGVGDTSTARWESVILSHTLEHIYDVPEMIQRIKSRLQSNGLLFVEIPMWIDYGNLSYDLHWQHVNKFRAQDLALLVARNNFSIVFAGQLPDYREYHTLRLVAKWRE